jgi:hypothetical protein
MNDAMTPIVTYSSLSDMYGVACKVKSDFVNVPPHLGIDDSKCCI